MTQTLSEIARGSSLRVAVNTGNRALVQLTDGELAGVSPALARRLAAELGLKMEVTLYEGAGKVFQDAGKDIWDVAFLAIDATRAKAISFTRPYHTIEATYAVRAGGGITKVEEADREGVTVLTSAGSAYDMHLTASLRAAKLERSGTPPESFAEFRAGRGDVVAGVRASLLRFFQDDPDVQVLPGVLTKVEQAMVLPGAGNPLTGLLDDFVARAIADGFVEAQVG